MFAFALARSSDDRPQPMYLASVCAFNHRPKGSTLEKSKGRLKDPNAGRATSRFVWLIPGAPTYARLDPRTLPSMAPRAGRKIFSTVRVIFLPPALLRLSRNCPVVCKHTVPWSERLARRVLEEVVYCTSRPDGMNDGRVTAPPLALDAPRIDAHLPTPWVVVWERINIGVLLLWVVVLAVALLRVGNASA
jgi:hypothetical protein